MQINDIWIITKCFLKGFREDRRNTARPVKPLYYGAFGSYAPSYDSAFANLTKEESALVLRTYGSDQAVQYAESVQVRYWHLCLQKFNKISQLQDFVKGCDYAEHLVDSLLDLLTGGEHSKTKTTIEEGKRFKGISHVFLATLFKKKSLTF